jgi:hypothetical protein
LQVIRKKTLPLQLDFYRAKNQEPKAKIRGSEKRKNKK